MGYIENLEARKATYTRFWRKEPLGRPIVSIFAQREHPLPCPEPRPRSEFPADQWLEPDYVLNDRLILLAHTRFWGDSIPHIIVDLGPGSLAAYLGCPVTCTPETVWFHKTMTKITEPLADFDPEQSWWRRHLELIRQAATLGNERGFYVALPDLIEGVDTLASLRGTSELIMDLLQEPETIQQHLQRLTQLYFRYYDQIHAVVADPAGWSICTYLEAFGKGRAGKIQCDFAALMNPKLFAEFALPSITQQAARFDFVAYHLDGPGAIYTVPFLAEIEKIRVIQWVAGAGHAPQYDQRWEKRVIAPLIEAGKTIQFLFHPPENGSAQEYRDDLTAIMTGVTRLIKTYGPDAFWLVFKYGYPEAIVKEVVLPVVRSWGVDIEG
jgi:hypothetical protein